MFALPLVLVDKFVFKMLRIVDALASRPGPAEEA